MMGKKATNWFTGYLRELRPKLAFPLYRNQLRLPAMMNGLIVRLARTKEDLEGSFRLLHDTHVELGWMKAHSSGLKVTPYNLLPHTSTIVALLDDKVVGTVNVIRDNEMGLPVNECFDTSFYRRPALQIAEITSLAVRREHRGKGNVMFPMLKYLYQYAVDYLKVDVFQIACSPKHEDFYRSIFFFEPVDDRVVADPFVDGASMLALYLDLNEAKTLCKRSYAGRPSDRNLYHYFVEQNFSNLVFPDRKVHQVLDPVMTPDLAKYFFEQQTALLDHLSDRELHVLREIYRGTPMEKLMREPRSLPPYVQKRGAQRHLVSCPAVLETDEGDEVITLLDVSQTGFRLATKYPLRLDESYNFRIQISSSQTVPLRAMPVWHRQRREWGFHILEVPSAWAKFLETLAASIKKAA